MFFKKYNLDQCDTHQPAQFEQVLEEELKYFQKRGEVHKTKRNYLSKRKQGNDECSGRDKSSKDECDTTYAASIVAKANKARLTGLAFSGGGIRSATFNLGVLQALARLKLLDQFDYLSTVSGGGYIGSWLAAWTKSKDNELKQTQNQSTPGKSKGRDAKPSNGLKEVARDLASSVSARADEKPRAALQPDPAPIWHLREYSNYLSPRRGIWSTDTWTLGVTYIRNLLLTLSLLLATLLTLVLATRAVASFYFNSAHGKHDVEYLLVPIIFYLLIFCASLLAGIELCGRTRKNQNNTVSNLAVVTTLLTASVGALWLWQISVSPKVSINMLANQLPWDFLLELITVDHSLYSYLSSTIPIVVLALLGWFAGLYIGRRAGKTLLNHANMPDEPSSPWSSFWLFIGAPLSSLAALIGLLAMLGSWMKTWLPTDVEHWDPGLWHIVVWGTPLFVLIFSLVAVVFVGVAGRALSELDREWLGRFFAVLLKYTVLITFLVALVIYSPCWVQWLGGYVIGPTAAWGTLSAVGAFLARNVMIGKASVQGWLKKAVLVIAPYVFILGMLILTVWITDLVVHQLAIEFELILAENKGEPIGFWYMMAELDLRMLLLMFALTALLMAFWSWRVGVNRFSLHSLYADRLIRAYLGASNLKRNAHPFTGFDDSDNRVRMSDLADSDNLYSGPYPIINAAINMVSSRRLAWQKRKAASFTFTPKYCGYEFCGENDASDDETNSDVRARHVGGFVDSACYAGKAGRGLSLGKAMTISGAAASPNMGYHSSPALTFLMTTFNVRLGWWLPNTAKKTPSLLAKRGPRWGLLYLLTELFGMTNARSNYVYLSDGGHFENLGIYELVRRRCRVIVASDAEADPDMTFSGLGNAIEKCRTDLGVPVEIDVSQMKPDTGTGRSLCHCAVGCIRYSEADTGQADGILIYIKASLTGDEPRDVSTYASAHASFPHETTADQWFDETQFESYRALGEHIMQKVLENAENVARSAVIDKKDGKRVIERVALEARKQWYPGSNAQSYKPANHDALLESIMDSLRNDTRLRFLDIQLYPNLQKVADAYAHKTHTDSKPDNYEEFRAGFYFCKRLIQFMQQVYYDRQLDIEYAAPRNRGWMNLFRRASWSRMLRFTWTMTAGTYGARFQSFCEHRLNLESGEPEFSKQSLLITANLSSETDQYQVDPVQLPGITDREAIDRKNAEDAIGLHYYESRLINEFITTYVQHEKLKTRSQQFKFQVFTLLVTTDDPVADQDDKVLELNAGFLIAGPPLDQSCENAVLYFRIRPSMRNMDLARKAFLECRKHDTLKKYPIRLVDKLPPISEVTKATWQRRAYRDVYSMDRENLDHCRWFSELLEEVDELKGLD